MSNGLKIEKNIKVPEGRKRSEKYFPWLEMTVGDSFAVLGKVQATSARGSFLRYQKMGQIPKDWIVVQRRVEGVENTFRLWVGIKKDH